MYNMQLGIAEPVVKGQAEENAETETSKVPQESLRMEGSVLLEVQSISIQETCYQASR